jgi:signal transduction histidine kinase
LQNEGAKKISIEFIDSGIGIDSKDLKQIFEPFYRGSNALSFKGHGIGLSLVERIIKLHNGSIKASSVPAEKTIFTVSLPTLS